MSHKAQKTVVIFGSSQPGHDSQDYRLAFETGEILAKNGYIIANGGYGGTMEASARGAKSAQAATLGVTCLAFGRKGPNQWIDKEIQTSDLNERLRKLIELGDAYVILPGGTGTLLEIAMVWELINKHFLPPRPMIFVTDFWKNLVKTIALCDKNAKMTVEFADNPGEIVKILRESSFS